MRPNSGRPDPDSLPRRALYLLAGPGDVAGARSAIAPHVGKDEVRLLLLTGGDAALAGVRAELGESAAELRALDLPPEGLPAAHQLAGLLRGELEDFRPRRLYAPAGERGSPDRRAAQAAARGMARAFDVELLTYAEDGAVRTAATRATATENGATAVVSNWNKREDLRENLDALRAQMQPFAEIVVVDNASGDGSARMVAQDYPEVRLVVMPHSRFGACETFNLGFAAARTPLVAILDDDVVLPPEWLERTVARLAAEPESTAVVSTEVIEPGMPDSFIESSRVARERYMSTFRGCASLARGEALERAGGYDERLFIYGNERDLTCRLLNLGYRVLHYPAVRVFHKTPFGIKMGRRSLYYHARNAWLTMLKYAPLSDLLRMPWLVLTRVLLRGGGTEASGEVSDATGTIGIGRSLRETPGAWWTLAKAALSVLANVPYCLRHRRPVRAPDFELPLS